MSEYIKILKEYKESSERLLELKDEYINIMQRRNTILTMMSEYDDVFVKEILREEIDSDMRRNNESI